MGNSSEARHSFTSLVCKAFFKPGIILALVMQGLVLCFLAGLIVCFRPLTSHLLLLIFLQALLPAILVLFLRWNWWWAVIQFFLPLLFYVVLSRGITFEYSLLFFIVVFLVHFGAIHSRVPYFPSNRKLFPIIALLLPTKTHAQVLDLGCGYGKVLMKMREFRPDLQYSGIELAILPYLLAKMLRRIYMSGTEIIYGNFFGLALNKYDFVYCYLSSAVMSQLSEKVSAEMRSGSVFVSCEFADKDFSPDLTINYKNAPPLYVWRI